MSLSATLDKLIQDYLNLQQPLGLPELPYESEWVSECYLLNSKNEGDPTPWQPVRISQPVDMFQRLGEALETAIHPDLTSYFTRYWSDPLYFSHPEGELSLLFCWNAEDMERLRANLIGHALNKRKLRQPLTLFLACTEPDAEQYLSIDNQDGSIWLERPGKGCIKQIAASLEEFLKDLTPLPHPR